MEHRPDLQTGPHASLDQMGAMSAAASRSDRQLGLWSGWISTSFGVLQFCAPRTFARAVGMRYPPALIRAVGARDFALGVGILAQPESTGWRWSRAVSDIMDVALVGAAAFAPSSRRRLGAFAALAAAVVAFDVVAARHRAPLAQTLLGDDTRAGGGS
jgi:hypothetical protein